jgi:hypothetical protein
MAYKDMPDCYLPVSALRCEVMTKACMDNTWQIWRRESHRCVRRAVQGRAGRSVCALHAGMKEVMFWNGEPDAFRAKVKID